MIGVKQTLKYGAGGGRDDGQLQWCHHAGAFETTRVCDVL